jgi:hypothetical protein
MFFTSEQELCLLPVKAMHKLVILIAVEAKSVKYWNQVVEHVRNSG